MADKSTISAGTTIVGNVSAKRDLEVRGRIEGSLQVQGDVFIAGGARLKSDVSAQRVVVAGAVAGNVNGEESVVLENGARVVGDLTAPAVGIRPGALMRGRVEAGGEGAPAPRRPGSMPMRATAPVAPAPKQEPEAVEAKAPEAPEPKMPKASGKAKKKAAKKAKAKAPAPVVPALKKRGKKKAAKRRSS